MKRGPEDGGPFRPKQRTSEELELLRRLDESECFDGSDLRGDGVGGARRKRTAEELEAALTCTELEVRGHPPLRILSDPIGLWGGSMGSCLWAAALALVEFFAAEPARADGKRVLELGAGLGAAGLALARLGATVRVTDRPSMLDLLQRNVRENDAKVAAAALSWGQLDPETEGAGPFDLVIGSDVAYDSESYLPLLETLTHFLQADAEAILALPDRREDAAFLEMAKLRFDCSLLRRYLADEFDSLHAISIWRFVSPRPPDKAAPSSKAEAC